MKKNAFLTFVFALFPGFGQMYQGYMRRGVSLTFWFAATIAVAALVRLEILMLLLPVIWAYSFFDTFNIRALSDAQRAAFGDNYLPKNFWPGQNGAGRTGRSITIAGWVIVAVGVLLLYNTLFDSFYWDLYNSFPALAAWLSRIPALLVGVVVIIVGVLVLRGRRTPPPSDDLNDFKGGDSHVQ